MMNSHSSSSLARQGSIRTIGVVGMGYGGIPSADPFAASPEFKQVYGFQRASPTSGYRIEMLNRGKAPKRGRVGPARTALRGGGTEKVPVHPDFLKNTSRDAVTLAIQTLFSDPKDLIPDFSALFDGLQQVGRHISEGTLIVLASTITPGTTEHCLTDPAGRTRNESQPGLCPCPCPGTGNGRGN